MSLARHILGRSAVAFGLLVGCASTTSSPATTPRRAQSSPTGYDITMQATACWMGGLWSDALGETGSERIDRIAGRCHQVLRSIVAPDDDYYPLRAVEWRLVDAIARRVQTVAEHNAAEAPSAHDLVALLHAIASASRETIDARRAADVVKEDEEQQ